MNRNDIAEPQPFRRGEGAFDFDLNRLEQTSDG